LGHPSRGATRRRSRRPKFFMARAAAPMFSCGQWTWGIRCGWRVHLAGCCCTDVLLRSVDVWDQVRVARAPGWVLLRRRSPAVKGGTLLLGGGDQAALCPDVGQTRQVHSRPL
jgi:hypothetical protein